MYVAVCVCVCLCHQYASSGGIALFACRPKTATERSLRGRTAAKKRSVVSSFMKIYGPHFMHSPLHCECFRCVFVVVVLLPFFVQGPEWGTDLMGRTRAFQRSMTILGMTICSVFALTILRDYFRGSREGAKIAQNEDKRRGRYVQGWMREGEGEGR